MLHKGLLNILCQPCRWMGGRRHRETLSRLTMQAVVDTNMSLKQACSSPRKATPDDRHCTACRVESQLAASQPWPTNEEKCHFPTHNKQAGQPRRAGRGLNVLRLRERRTTCLGRKTAGSRLGNAQRNWFRRRSPKHTTSATHNPTERTH